jgi:hypothetical protein
MLEAALIDKYKSISTVPSLFFGSRYWSVLSTHLGEPMLVGFGFFWSTQSLSSSLYIIYNHMYIIYMSRSILYKNGKVYSSQLFFLKHIC